MQIEIEGRSYFIFHSNNLTDPLQMKEMAVKHNDIVGIIDAKNLICDNQVLSAIYRSLRSMRSGTAISAVLPIEIMLQITGTHQIKKALAKFDVNSATKNVIVIQTVEDPVENRLLTGLGTITPGEDIILSYFNEIPDDPCKAVISLGVRMVVDHE